MPKQLTTKRKAEAPDYGQEAMPTKKLQKPSSQPALNSPPRTPSLTSDSSIEDSPSSQPALNIPPRLASATDSSLSESPPPPSLTSDSSIEDSPSSKSSASTASIENSSSAVSTTGACSTSMLQETRLNHGSEQGEKVTSADQFYGMNLEQLKEYGRSRGWEIPAEYDSVPGDCDLAIDYDSDDFDSHADIDYCYGLGEFGYVGE